VSFILRAKKKEEKEENTEAIRRVERIYGKFERMISLPPNVKTQEAKAEYKYGILEIRFPKKEESQSIKINIYLRLRYSNKGPLSPFLILSTFSGLVYNI